ncbi:GNAT family N-acetyltransferase [candidate division KSB1 bacterium]|nr:GNAT family N-acetyltransferase [candidate division KSB1 bacterium]NIR70307.1 GNAT family N-acetyltransferase [candidate division KSB1 bacterium]NIS27611.1 GNAT family N-acetyltransferase [candidate division KSB1 bacterium]NIT74451.1 GNAT family N-acetyltransferase [candidate division KSB1 bacterium]NIU28976.1 GNAT family N-acetyltransferase [candidate division KSB1 bacterium]
MSIIESKKETYLISTDKNRLDLKLIHGFIASHWAKDILFARVKKSVENSLCFGVYEDDKQIGFARVLTDYARIAYLADVFILESYRGRGLSKWLMECIMAHPDLQDLRKWILATKDAHGLYRKYGFEPLSTPEHYMEKVLHKLE